MGKGKTKKRQIAAEICIYARGEVRQGGPSLSLSKNKFDNASSFTSAPTNSEIKFWNDLPPDKNQMYEAFQLYS